MFTMRRMGFDCFPCSPLSAGGTGSKYRWSALDESAMNHRVREKTIYLFPPCLRGSVVQRFCLPVAAASHSRAPNPPASGPIEMTLSRNLSRMAIFDAEAVNHPGNAVFVRKLMRKADTKLPD